MTDTKKGGGAAQSYGRGRDRPTAIIERAAIRFQRCKLMVMTGQVKGTRHELTKDETLVGSDADCDLQLPDDTVSKRHFLVIRDGESFLVRDLRSTNGTLLDNARVKEAYIRPGSLLQAGEVGLRVEPVYERIDIVPSEATQFGSLVGRSLAMREIFAVLEKVASTEATVLLQGETGTGKGAVARAIHQASPRADGPFVVFDCGAISPTLVESELFGHERGAFTGAVQQRRGALEAANGGTLFVDELADLAIELQPKLLRALEDREFVRVGSNRPIKVSCRVVAASQRDLASEVRASRFREDLYFRIAVVTVPLPPLRARSEDIPMLVDRFLAEKGLDGFDSLDEELKHELLAHAWPGNIRELRNSIERVTLVDSTGPLAVHGDRGQDPPAMPAAGWQALGVDFELPFKDAKERLVAAFEREYLVRLTERAQGNIARAAREAGIDRKHLYVLLAKHGIGPGTGS